MGQKTMAQDNKEHRIMNKQQLNEMMMRCVNWDKVDEIADRLDNNTATDSDKKVMNILNKVGSGQTIIKGA
jgi:hypothetical protein